MKTQLAETRGRFVVQEVDENEIICRKSRHYSMNRPMTHLFYSSDEKDFHPNKISFLSYVRNLKNEKWENINDLWNKTKRNLVNERKNIDIIFSYDLVNKIETELEIGNSDNEYDDHLLFISSNGRNESKFDKMDFDDEYDDLVNGGNFSLKPEESVNEVSDKIFREKPEDLRTDFHTEYESNGNDLKNKSYSENEMDITSFNFSIPPPQTRIN